MQHLLPVVPHAETLIFVLAMSVCKFIYDRAPKKLGVIFRLIQLLAPVDSALIRGIISTEKQHLPFKNSFNGRINSKNWIWTSVFIIF